MSITQAAGVISILLALYSGYPYIKSVLNGKTRPHQLSWLVFTIMNGIVFFAQYLAGGRISTLVSLTFFVYSLAVFLLSFNKGTRNTSKADKSLFIFAVIAIIAWGLTRSNVLAIWLTLFIDLAATLMTILKARKQPDSEDPAPWLFGMFAYVFACITLFNVHFGILWVRPIYGLVCDAALFGSTYYYKSHASALAKR